MHVRFLTHSRIAFFCLLFVPLFLASQSATRKEPRARFSFTNKANFDDSANHKAKLSGTVFSEDRFGNANSAVYLFGNEHSYISFGTDSVFKPTVGSISLWVKIGGSVWSGRGYTVNPIILTKNSNNDDFYESYGINWVPEVDLFVMNCSQDSINQIVIPTTHKLEFITWYHLALTFDNQSIAFYVNGELQGKQVKDFRISYLPTDSVLIGVTANKKNNRFFRGWIDDVEFYDYALSDEEVMALYNAPNPNKNAIILRWVLIVNGILLVLLIAYFFLRYRRAKAQKKEKERLELLNKLLETELRVNRALMNPHFVYNSLYSIQSLILNREIEQANTYLVKFSRLLRKTLEGNLSDAISLEAEIDLLKQFIEIENLKFEGQIISKVSAEGFPALGGIFIPVMMVQPFVENAIWHGLKHRQGDKILNITFRPAGEKLLECLIDDNGTGRIEKAEKTPENKSLATGFIQTRLSLINKIYGLNCTLTITDKPEHSGTTVSIVMPVFSSERVKFSDPYTVK